MEALKRLVELSCSVGSDEDLVLAGGGNTSYKDEEKMWVKASGFELGNITEEGFVVLDRKRLKKMKEGNLSEEEAKNVLLSSKVHKSDKVPSVETYFHEIIDYPFIVHIHPWLVNSLVCSKNGKSIYKRILGEDILWINFYRPGYLLSRKIDEEIRKFIKEKNRYPHVFLLQNHGIIVGGKNPNKIKEEIYKILESIRKYVKLPDEKRNIGFSQEEISSWIRDALGERRIIYYLEYGKIPSEVAKESFTPDQVVYCRPNSLWIERSSLEKEKFISSLKSFMEEKYEPKIIAADGVGIFGIGRSFKLAKNASLVFRDSLRIYHGSLFFGGPKFLNKEYVEFIDNWEVERYRRKIAGESGE